MFKNNQYEKKIFSKKCSMCFRGVLPKNKKFQVIPGFSRWSDQPVIKANIPQNEPILF
jgi:hypothetical protein